MKKNSELYNTVGTISMHRMEGIVKDARMLAKTSDEKYIDVRSDEGEVFPLKIESLKGRVGNILDRKARCKVCKINGEVKIQRNRMQPQDTQHINYVTADDTLLGFHKELGRVLCCKCRATKSKGNVK